MSRGRWESDSLAIGRQLGHRSGHAERAAASPCGGSASHTSSPRGNVARADRAGAPGGATLGSRAVNLVRQSPDDAAARLRETGYLADAADGATAYLAGALEKPLLVEGPAGVGKTELAKAVARATGAELVRLQCYEGLDEARALYEWNYKKQLLRIQAAGGDAVVGARPTTTSSPRSSCSPGRC